MDTSGNVTKISLIELQVCRNERTAVVIKEMKITLV